MSQSDYEVAEQAYHRARMRSNQALADLRGVDDYLVWHRLWDTYTIASQERMQAYERAIVLIHCCDFLDQIGVEVPWKVGAGYSTN